MDTIVALSTPFGVSGIAVIRLSGDRCPELAQSLFHRTDLVPRRTYYGHYYLVDQPKDPLDEVVFVSFAAGASYTGETMLEVSCHGNPMIIQQIIRDCIQRGCRQAEPGEFTRRAFMNGVLDLCQAEAVEELIHAQSMQALRLAQKQLGGALSQVLNPLIQTLTDQIAQVEAYLDFPEEDLPDLDCKRFEEQLQAIATDLDCLIQAHAAYGPLHRSIQVVMAGQPNAGKSTLFNRLLGRQRVLVSAIPGTTRDYVSEPYVLDPYTLTLTDTAGLRDSQDPLERLGIGQTDQQVRDADCIIWVVDGSQPEVNSLRALQPKFPKERTWVLINKADLGINPEVPMCLQAYVQDTVSLTDAGSLESVQKGLRRFLQAHIQEESQVAFMVSERHAAAFEQARQYVKQAQNRWHQRAYGDCLAADLKAALNALGSVVGQVDYERVLDAIFSKFCIGK